MSNVLQISKSNLSHALRNLEKKGLLKREMIATDARGYVFSLSTSGKKKALGLVKAFDEVEAVLEKNISLKTSKEFI